MSTFDIQLDAPGLLRVESLSIVLTFTRTGPTTGRIAWNIPTPAAGCNANTQAYCGIIIALDTVPSSPTALPINREIYTSDPTADLNLFVGDKIGTSLVIGAFYQDRITTSMEITGLSANTPYYITGFPCDCEYRYFVEGVHSYSMDLTTDMGKGGTHGYQLITLNGTNGVSLLDYTGLSPTINYDFQIQIGLLPYPTMPPTPLSCPASPPTFTITVNGTHTAQYSDLVYELNKQLALVDNPYQNTTAPNTGTLYWDGIHLYTWDGYKNVSTPFISHTTDPTILSVGSYWYDNTTLRQWDITNSWVVITNIINSKFDPIQPIADTSYWIDTTPTQIQGYLWNGVTWCIRNTIVSITDPSIPPTITPGSYWYDTLNKTLYSWDTVFGMWTTSSVIISDTNPSLLPSNSYWFNTNTNTLFIKDNPTIGWNQVLNSIISSIAPTNPINNQLWYNTETTVLQQWDSTNHVWMVISVIISNVDPLQRHSCDLWWNSTTNILYSYDIVNGNWKQVTQFFIQSTDPTIAPTLTYNTIWYNPTTGIAQNWMQNCFNPINAIYSTTDPTIRIDGEIWHDTSNNTWKRYDILTSTWNQVFPILSTLDPNITNPTNATNLIGTIWLNPSTTSINYWNGMGWVNVSFSTVSPAPNKGMLWFNNTNNSLLVWNGTTWISAIPRATVELDCNGNLLFTDSTLGSLSSINITDNTMFKSLTSGFQYGNTYVGGDEVSNQPSWKELGIGTDGNDDARRLLANEIRMALGYPVIDVELTHEQLDLAITTAISEIRAKSGLGYKSGYFFLHTTPEQSRYLLTNKSSGSNKVVDILSIQRVNSLASGGHDSGIYGQIFANFLYNAGNFDLLSYHLMTEYKKTYEILFAQRIQWVWNEHNRELHLMQRMPYDLYLAIECTVERTEQDIMTDRYCVPWVRRYATALARIMLAEIRGKFSTLPGAGGGITLNANDLRMAAKDELMQCLEEIDNFLMDDPATYGMSSSMTFG